MNLYYQISQIKANGKVKKYPKKRSRSFVKAFICHLYTFSSNLITTLADIGGTTRNTGTSYSSFLNCSNPGGHANVYSFSASEYANSNYNAGVGIVVGTGNTAVASTDNKLGTIITSGTASGELEYFSDVVSEQITVSAPNATHTVYRIFRNGSGGDVTIKELGIYSVNDYQYTYCMVRDVLSVPVTMSNGDYLKVTYTFQITA